MRITGQLIDASTGAHLWADRFEGELHDIFELQDQVTDSVVGAIAPTLQKAEIERAKRKSTDNLDAYDCYLRGLAFSNQGNDLQAVTEALRHFNRAIELDPSFAVAYVRAAMYYGLLRTIGHLTDQSPEIAEAKRLARRGTLLGKDDAEVLATGAWVLAHLDRDLDASAAMIDRALMLSPNRAGSLSIGGLIKIWLGEPDAGIERLTRAMRLSPLDPAVSDRQFGMALAYFFLDRYDEASSWAETALREAPEAHHILRIHEATHLRDGWSRHGSRSQGSES